MDRGSQLDEEDEEDEDDKDDEEDEEDEEEEEDEEDEDEDARKRKQKRKRKRKATNIKSNNPHLAGGEKQIIASANNFRSYALTITEKKITSNKKTITHFIEVPNGKDNTWLKCPTRAQLQLQLC